MSALAPAYTSYAQCYLDAQLDPFDGAYWGVLGAFATNTTKESANVATCLLIWVMGMAEAQPHAYLLVQALPEEEPYITMVHQPFSITPLLGDLEPEQQYCFLGDVSQLVLRQVMNFPPSPFEPCGNVRVPLDDVMDCAISPDQPVCGPYAEEDVGTEVVTVRRMMYLPPKFVPIALAHPKLSPGEAWEIISKAVWDDAGNMETESSLDSYRPLLSWLKVVATYVVQEGNNMIAPAMSHELTFPVHLDDLLHCKIKQILNNDLPGYGINTRSQEAATVAAINEHMSRIVEANEVAVLCENRAEEKTLTGYYGEGLVILLRVCHTNSAAELPSLWRAISRSTKIMRELSLRSSSGHGR